jgi:uncharacterized surface protein with fasciclin (FAS1) repeats
MEGELPAEGQTGWLHARRLLTCACPLFICILQSLEGFTSQLADMQRSKMTVFLPSDDAWEAFFEETDTNATELIQHPERLTSLLTYHIYTADAFLYADYQPLTMASGDPLYPCKLMVTGAKGICDMAGRSAGLVDKRQVGGRVMVYVTDRVLLNVRPKTVDEALTLNTQFSAFRQAMAAANYTGLLASSTASVTLLVPTNSAFDEALQIMVGLGRTARVDANPGFCLERAAVRVSGHGLIAPHLLIPPRRT